MAPPTSPNSTSAAKIALLAVPALLLALAAIWSLTLSNSQPKTQSLSPEAAPRPQINFLSVGDPFAHILDNQVGALDALLGAPTRIHIRRYARTLEEIRLNAKDQTSLYHLVSFDILWLPSLANDGVLSPLSAADIAAIGRDLEADFFPLTIEVNRHNGTLYGLPIQPHAEILWFRKDLLSAAGFQPPATFDELLRQARFFHNPAANFYGICWNALRGQALGQTIAHLFGEFGQSILSPDFSTAQIDSPTGLQVTAFLQALLAVSPPDILTMAWDQRIERFVLGNAAFTYGWTARAAMAELNPLSAVVGNVGYAPPPTQSPNLNSIPFGQWSVGIPSNLPDAERPAALRALAGLFSDKAYAIFQQNGLTNLYRRGLAPQSPDSPFGVVANALDAQHIDLSIRPLIPQWPAIADVLGTVFHDFLQGRIDQVSALQSAQQQVQAILDARPPQ